MISTFFTLLIRITDAVNVSYIYQLNEQSLTVQVVVVTSEDREGVNRTILLVDLALFWNPQEVNEYNLITRI